MTRMHSLLPPEALIDLCCLSTHARGAMPAVRGLLAEARKAENANYLPAVAEGVLAPRREVSALPA